ncbi:hypothetical protein [Alloalcanivorax xenomutans]|uniref:hypothetical protein n=1 Tax=Alloalcanivorax xenomutans TaxID=1094342 RepID=UPI001F298391|nr:hypothetical protein [Alloalcanivorax xenomutans]MCE7521974.1 hypothetical protein [Alloalcanivorax xenomutans]
MSEIDWHGLFDGYLKQAGHHPDDHYDVWDGRDVPDWAKRQGDPFTSDRYPDIPRVTLPGGAHVMAADGKFFILTQSALVKQGEHYRPLLSISPYEYAQVTAFTVNGFLFVIEHGRIERVGSTRRLPLRVDFEYRLHGTRHIMIHGRGRLRGLGLQGPG